MNNPRSRLHCFALAMFLLVTVGCGGAQRGAVGGKVTLDGQPVDGGTITFIPLAAKQDKPAWAQIAAGEYSLDASRGPALGPNRVEIRWPRKTGRKTSYDPTIDEMREAIPDRYNRDSELQADVKPGSNQFDFALHSR